MPTLARVAGLRTPGPVVPRPAGWSLAALALLAAACGGGGPSGKRAAPDGVSATTVVSTATTPRPTSTATGTAPVVAVAGDIACEPGQRSTAAQCRMDATADLVAAARPAAVLTLGDNQYDDGSLEKFETSYAMSWGRFKDITRPSAGNHDLAGDHAGAGYFSYFGSAAGSDGAGWYSFDLAGWHLVALNSNCKAVGGCGEGSAQLRWLEADLAASAARCTLAYWHHPRFSSGYHGGDRATQELWRVLADAGADLVLNGHDHHYERFAPMDRGGAPDGERGMRQFVVGTGGRSLYPLRATQPGSEVRQSSTFGVLLLTLGDGEYRWRFEALPGSRFADAGAGRCH